MIALEETVEKGWDRVRELVTEGSDSAYKYARNSYASAKRHGRQLVYAVALAGGLALMLAGCGKPVATPGTVAGDTPVPRPSAGQVYTRTPTDTATPEPSSTPTPRDTATATPEPSSTPTSTASPTVTYSPTASATVVMNPSSTPSSTPYSAALGTETPMTGTILTNDDLVSKVLATHAQLDAAPGKLVHPLQSGDVSSALFASTANGYGIVYRTEKAGVTLFSPVAAEIVAIMGDSSSPFYNIHMKLDDKGNDMIAINFNTKGATLDPATKNGAKVSRGQPLAVLGESYNTKGYRASMTRLDCSKTPYPGCLSTTFVDIRNADQWVAGIPMYMK
jgi:hypothetical protein